MRHPAGARTHAPRGVPARAGRGAYSFSPLAGGGRGWGPLGTPPPSSGGFRAAREPLGLQFEKGTPVILRRDLHKSGDRIAPVFQECVRSGTDGEQGMAFEENAEYRGIAA